MTRTFISELLFPYPWAETALGVLYKYPNPQATHVVSVDTISQQLEEASGRVRLERILGVRQGAPRWVVKLLNLSEDTYVREIMMIDPGAKKVEMTSTNLTLSEYLLVKEYITYIPSPSAPSASTTFRQVADITCTSTFGGGILATAAKKLEELSFDRFGNNAQKGKEGLMSVLASLWGTAPLKCGEPAGRTESRFDWTAQTTRSDKIKSPKAV